MGKSSTDTGWTPAEIALKSFFLGPQAENAVWVKSLVERIVTNWIEWRRSLYVDDGSAITPEEQNQPEFIARLDQLRSLVEQLLRRFEGEIPSFNPRYIGHMMSEVSVPAFLGHLITLIHNPNNVVHEASLVGTELEREAINDLARMMGFDPVLVRGHFTSGGTVANIEGLVRARARMSRWISAAAYLKSKGQKTGTLFEGAHGGWENYDRLTKQDKTPELRKLDLLHNNPFDVAQELQRLFGTPYR